VEAPAGFEEFVRTQSRGLLRAAWLLTGDWASAEDLVQSALAATWPRWSALTRPDAPEVYVRRVIVTTFLRGRRRRWTGEVSHAELPEIELGVDAYVRADQRAVLVQALAELPARQRAVIVLRFFGDLSERETAAALGCSVGAVKSHTAKAISRLRHTPALASELNEEVQS